MGIRECIAYNKNLITGEYFETSKKKENKIKARGIATIELFDSESGDKIYEAKSENLINDINGKMAYMDYFYYKIKGNTDYSFYENNFNTLALFNNNEPEKSDNLVIRGERIGYAYKANTYSGSDKYRGTINENESNLDEDGSGRIHFVFDFPTHVANGTFQKIAWLKLTKNTYFINLVNTDQGNNTILDSQMGLAYRGTTVYQLEGTVLRISDINSLENYTDYTLGSDRYQNGIYVTESNIWTVGRYKKIYKYDLNRNLIKVYELDIDISGGTGRSAELHYIYIDDTGVYLGAYISYDYGGTLLKLSLDLETVLAEKYYPEGSEIQMEYRRGGFGTFDEDKIIFMESGHRYALVDKNTLEFITTGTTITSRVGWQFAENEEGKRIATGYKNGSSSQGYAFSNVNFESLIGAETLLAAPVTKTPTNTMKIQYTFEVTKVL